MLPEGIADPIASCGFEAEDLPAPDKLVLGPSIACKVMVRSKRGVSAAFRPAAHERDFGTCSHSISKSRILQKGVRREHPKDDYVFVSERWAVWQLPVAKVGGTSTGKLYRKTLAMRPLRCVREPRWRDLLRQKSNTD